MKMPKLSHYAGQRVIALYFAGINLTKIAKLLEEEGMKASLLAVQFSPKILRQSLVFTVVLLNLRSSTFLFHFKLLPSQIKSSLFV